MVDNIEKIKNDIYNFIKSSQFKYISYNEIYRFCDKNRLFNLIKYDYVRSNKQTELKNILDLMCNENMIKKEIHQMLTSYYV